MFECPPSDNNKRYASKTDLFGNQKKLVQNQEPVMCLFFCFYNHQILIAFGFMLLLIEWE